MNKRRTRLSLTALLMALLMVLSCGCAGDPSAPTTESTPTTATTQSTTAPEKVDPNAPVDRVGREVDSITQSEFYQAANTELNPEYTFTIFFGDYKGEPLVEFHGVRYAIYRTYRADDNLELYTERKIGA